MLWKFLMRASISAESVVTKGEWIVRHGSGFRDALVPIFRVLVAIGQSATHPIKVSWRLLDTRTLEQNARMNAMCAEVASQVEWHGQRLSKDEWRHMFVASYRQGQKVVPGIDGGFVVLGASSRDLSVSECGDLMELIAAFGAERGVIFKE
jgi:hypothetical protein